MEAWKKKKGLLSKPRFVCVLEPMEREVLGDLAAAVSEALIARAQSAPKDPLAELTGISSGHKQPPSDPGLARLLPNFEREGDEEFEGDNALLRSLHENDILRAKLENLQVIVEKLGPDGSVNVTVDEAQARAWVAAVNDIRLYLASSDVAGPPGFAADRDSVVEWLAFNQDSLLQAMMGPLD